jgi:hypothetical protein
VLYWASSPENGTIEGAAFKIARLVGLLGLAFTIVFRLMAVWVRTEVAMRINAYVLTKLP